jgi:hypothetical protein
MPAILASQALPFGRIPKRVSQPVWGQDLVELPLNSLWYQRSWADVSDDELVLFIPTLTERHHREFGVAARIRASFMRRLHASTLLSSQRNAAPRQDGTKKHMIVAEKAIADRLGPSSNRPPWATEAAILNSIERMLWQACSEGEDTTLPDALLASIHTSINAAYVYPRCAFAHELLATGAWFGKILMGRKAVMPEFAALICEEYLADKRQDPISEILRFHAQRLGGTALYMQGAKKTIKSGRAVVLECAL